MLSGCKTPITDHLTEQYKVYTSINRRSVYYYLLFRYYQSRLFVRVQYMTQEWPGIIDQWASRVREAANQDPARPAGARTH